MDEALDAMASVDSILVYSIDWLTEERNQSHQRVVIDTEYDHQMLKVVEVGGS